MEAVVHERAHDRAGLRVREVEALAEVAAQRTQLGQLVDYYMDGTLKIDELVTKEIALQDINNAFDLMRQDQGYRYVVKY